MAFGLFWIMKNVSTNDACYPWDTPVLPRGVYEVARGTTGSPLIGLKGGGDG